MGFFKRKDDEAGPGGASGERTRGRRVANRRDASVDPLDPLELAKKRARRRLIGAVALVLGAIVLLPMVFDSEPKNASDDLSVEIPSQNSSFNPAMPVAASSAAGSVAGSAAPTNTPASAPLAAPAAPVTPVAPAAQSTLVPGAPLTAAESSAARGNGSSNSAMTPGPATSNSATTAASIALTSSPAAVPTQGSASTRNAASTSASATTKQPDAKTDKTTPKTATTGHNDDPRALAALEGKDITPTSPSERSAESFAVQIGAFSNADKVKEVRDRLQAAGLKPYTENLSTSQGPRTRVRVGPFATHEAAESAREKVKGLGYDGSVVTL